MAEQPIVEVVENPLAGDGTDGPQTASWFKRLIKDKMPKVKYTNALDERECRGLEGRLRQRSADVIVFKGGDGTLQQWLTRLLPQLIAGKHKLPLIFIVKCGTQNVAAAELGVVGPDPKRTMTAIVEKLALGLDPDVSYRHVLRVNEAYGFIYGTGVVTNLLARYYQDRKPGQALGVRRSVQVAAGVFAEEIRALALRRAGPPIDQPFPAAVGIIGRDGSVIERKGDYTGMIVSTLTQIGLHLQPTYRALEHHDTFHIVASQAPFWKMARGVPHIFLGVPSPIYAIDEVAREVRIRFCGSPPKRTLDAEWPDGPSDEDVITLGPRLGFVRS